MHHDNGELLMSDVSLLPSENKKSFDDYYSVFASVPKNRVRLPNADPAAIVTEMHKRWPGLLEMRSQLGKLFDFNIQRFDSLPDFIRALAYASAIYNMRTRPSDEFLGKVKEAIELRTILSTDIHSLTNHKCISIDMSQLPPMTMGYENVATYLSTFGEFLLANWASVGGKSAIQANDVNRALALASYIQEALGLRTDKAIHDAADMRARTFTVAVDTYNDARSAIVYLLRGKGNADEIAPSLFAAQNKGRKHPSKTNDTTKANNATRSANPIPRTTQHVSPTLTKPNASLPILPDVPGGDPYRE
jgi:hypothetical protein